MSGLFGRANAQQSSILKGLRAQTSVYGSIIPLIYGRTRIPGNLIDYNDFTATKQKAQGGKGGLFGGGGKGGGASYTYSAAPIIALGIGPFAQLLNVYDTAGQMTLTDATETYTVPGGGGTFTPAHAANFYQDLGVTRNDSYSVPYNDYGNPAGGGTLTGTTQSRMTAVGSGPTAGQYVINTANGHYTFAAADAGKVMNVTYSYATPTNTTNGQPITLASLTFFKGSQGQAAWGYMTSNHSSKALGYSGTAYVASSKMNLGASGALPNMSFEVIALLPWGGGQGDSNPKDVFYDVLTNSVYGMGFPTGEIGDLSAFSNYCIANGLFISPVFDTDQPAQQWLGDILSALNCEAFMSGGLLQIVPYGDTTVVGNGVTFTPNTTPVYDLADDDFLEQKGADPIQIVRPTIADVFNSVRVEYLNRGNHYNAEIIEEFDQSSIETFVRRQTSPTPMHFFCLQGAAQQAANLQLKRLVYIRSQYKFKLDQRYILLDPMDLVTLTDANLGLNKTPVRILSISEDEKRNLDITAEEFPWGTAQPTAYPKPSGLPTLPVSNADPGSVNTPVMFEALSRMNDQIGHSVVIGISGASPNWGGCRVWVSVDGTDYKEEDVFFSKSRMGVLTSALASHADPDTTDSFGVDLTESSGQLLGGTQDDCDNFRTLCFLQNDPTALASDSFARANGAPGANWTTTKGSLTIVSNTIQSATFTGGYAAMYYSAASFADDQFSELKISTLGSPNTNVLGPCVRMDASAATWYWSFYYSGNVYIQKLIAGSATNIAQVGHTPVAGDVLRLEIVGANLTLKINGTIVLTATDSALTTGKVGIAGNAVTTPAGQNWNGGNLTPAGELISYQDATLTSAFNYTLGTRLRRGVFGSAIGSHSSGSLFLRLDDNVFSYNYDPTLIGETLHFKFTSFNLTGNMEELLSAVTDYTIPITGSSLGLLTPAHATYRPTTNPLTGHDAGASATVNIAAFAMRIPGINDISISSGSITGLSYNTLYYIYYDDPGFAGGTVTFVATTTKSTALNAAGRFFIGSIITPRAGAPDSIGNDDGGSGAQSGQVNKFAMSLSAQYLQSGNGAVSGAANAVDGDLTTKAIQTITGNGSLNQIGILLSGPSSLSRRFSSSTLKVRWGVPSNNIPVGGGSNVVAINYVYQGSLIAVIASLQGNQTQSPTTTSYALPQDINLSQVGVQMVLNSAGASGQNSGAAELDTFEAWIEAIE